MVKLNKIYTKTGDDGTTGLVSGKRVDKDDLRVEAFGSVDEVNAALGLARSRLDEEHKTVDEMLARIQNDLFDLGADLATPLKQDEAPNKVLRIQSHQVERIEQEIDLLNESLQPLTSFVLPGGKTGVAELHLARTICRRAERNMVSLNRRDPINKQASLYINRVSDFLFVASRALNDGGKADILWVPGENR